MAFPDDLTPEQILDTYSSVLPPPVDETERRSRVATRFRTYFVGDVAVQLEVLGNEPASAEREERARALRIRLDQARALMLKPKYEFLVEGHARFIQQLDDEIRELIA